MLSKLFALIDTDKAGAGQVSVNQVMAVITEYTSERLAHSYLIIDKKRKKMCNIYFCRRNLHILYPGRAEELFRSIVTNGNREMSFEDFKKLIPSKNVRHTDPLWSALKFVMSHNYFSTEIFRRTHLPHI